MLAEIHQEVFSNWENGKPKKSTHINSFNVNDQSLIFTNLEDALKTRLKASIDMLDELQLNTTIVHYCENENDFGSIIKKMETSNFLARFHFFSIRPIRPIVDLFSDTHTLSWSKLILNSQKEVFEVRRSCHFDFYESLFQPL